tara:strand:+ start:16601 stop:17926 length:1326 start_codon:yes stop_codon:yes gene_type:complete
MKVFFYCPNKNLPKVLFNEPDKGNPGCGATEYLQVAIPFFLKKYFSQYIEVTIVADDISTMPSNLNVLEISNGLNGAIKVANDNNSDIFIFKPSQNQEKSIFDLIDKFKLKTIAIGQLTPNPRCLRYIGNCKFIKAFVCVGLNQYDQLVDSCIRNKIININNAISDNLFEKNMNMPYLQRKDIVFMGALFPQKNFLYLAECWRFISKKLPNAYLHVLGSAKTYGIDVKVGKKNLADHKYEELIFKALNKDPLSAKKVIFHGNVGDKKYQIISQSKVGIVNPLGTTETCCVSAVEMQSLGTPVCTGNYQALKTTVLNKKSGLLSYTRRSFINNIVNLYSDEKLFNKLSKGSIINAKLNFSFSHLIWKWYYLLYITDKGFEVNINQQPSFIQRKFKIISILRYINLFLLKNLLSLESYSVSEFIFFMKRLFYNFKKFLKKIIS